MRDESVAVPGDGEVLLLELDDAFIQDFLSALFLLFGLRSQNYNLKAALLLESPGLCFLEASPYKK
jgi:hypothetical protein